MKSLRRTANVSTLHISAFIYKLSEVDHEFRRLSTMIKELAPNIPGFVGVESWQSIDGQFANTSYYWRDQESLKAFTAAPIHLYAKRQFSKWYDGYHVVISKVEHAYGDGSIEHFMSDSKKATFA
jgi:heme-degrading monooxygenase HmoA